MTLIKENPPTYKTLHRDLNLKHLGKGRYDRELVNGDFRMVDGIHSLHNGIRIKLMTIWGEMQNSHIYNKFGNYAWAYLKAQNIDLIRVAIKEQFKIALEEMRRILSVDDIQIKMDEKDCNNLIITYMVTSISDQQLTGGVVLSQ